LSAIKVEVVYLSSTTADDEAKLEALKYLVVWANESFAIAERAQTKYCVQRGLGRAAVLCRWGKQR
jgi:hypothetical protein